VLVSRWRPTGIELARIAAFLCRTISARLERRPQSVQADRASFTQVVTASGQDHRLTKSDSDKGAATIQSMRNRSEHMASEEPPGDTTERTSNHPPLAAPAAGCGSRRSPETSLGLMERDTKSVGAEFARAYCRVTSEPNSIYQAALQGARCEMHLNTILRIWFSELPRAALRDLTQGSESKLLLSRRGNHSSGCSGQGLADACRRTALNDS
jgi:hypothetical protein